MFFHFVLPNRDGKHKKQSRRKHGNEKSTAACRDQQNHEKEQQQKHREFHSVDVDTFNNRKRQAFDPCNQSVHQIHRTPNQIADRDIYIRYPRDQEQNHAAHNHHERNRGHKQIAQPEVNGKLMEVKQGERHGGKLCGKCDSRNLPNFVQQLVFEAEPAIYRFCSNTMPTTAT